jgi:adenylate cyclase
MKEKILYFIGSFVVAILVLLLHFYKVSPFESFSLRFNDINFDFQKKEISKDIVFVAVDEPSVNEFGRWPWKRSVLADGISKLSKADVVLMDMIFSEPTSTQEDEALAQGLASLNASVCGFFLRHKATQEIGDDELDVLSDSSLDLLQSQISEYKNPNFIHAKFAEMNILPILESCTLSGSFTTLVAKDHLFRSYPIAVYFQNILYPSLAMQGLRIKFNKDINRLDALHVEIDKKQIALDENGFVRLNYYQKDQYQIISFLDLAKGVVKPEFFKDKIVILGITEVGAGDVVSTPMGSIPGPLLHYTFLSNLLQNHLIVELSYLTPLLIVLMALLPFVLILTFKKITHRVFSYTLVYLAVYAFVRYLFVADMIYADLFYPLISLILSVAFVEVLAFNIQEKSDKFLRDTFSSYLSGDLLQELIDNPDSLNLGGEKKELSILFSDIRGFTTISESMSPEELIILLNRYFTPMTKSVLHNKGMLDKYIGDAVMAFFNAPIDVPEHADAVCRCALSMIDKLDKLNKDLAAEGSDVHIKIGVGINTAEVIVGNIGSDDRKEYTVIGDGVNLASRVEGLTKNYGVSILITEFTLQKLSPEFTCREIEHVKVKGKDEAVVLYELMRDNAKEMKKLYDEALEFYKNNDLHNSKMIFSKLVQDYDDNVSKYFLNRIDQGHEWAINKMETK